MPRFRVLVRSLIAGRIAEPGDIVDLASHTSFASANLQPLDADAAALRDLRDEHTAESAPPGSATANEMSRMMLIGKTLSAADVQGLYTYSRRST